MQLVGPRLGGEVEHASEHLTVLGREVCRLHRELADGLDRRGGHRARPDRVVRAGDVLAFEVDLEGAARGAVDAGAFVGPGHARRQGDESQPVADRSHIAAAAAEIQRQLVDPIAADVDALLRVVGLQQRGFCRDADRFRGGAQLQRGVDARRLRDLDAHRGEDERLESHRLDRQVVDAGGQGAERVVARAGRDGAVLDPGLRIPGHDLRTGDDGRLRIRHPSSDGTSIALRRTRNREGQQEHGARPQRGGELESLVSSPHRYLPPIQKSGPPDLQRGRRRSRPGDRRSLGMSRRRKTAPECYRRGWPMSPI